MSNFARYLERSRKHLSDQTFAIVHMTGLDAAPPLKMLYTFNTPKEMLQYARGSDKDIGGKSTVHLDLDTTSPKNADIYREATGKFWGDMRLTPRPGFEGKVKVGYAGFRNTYNTSLFGEIHTDLSRHQYLAFRVRLAGPQRSRDSFYVNVQTDGAIASDLWQQRLFFQRTDGEWEDIYVPINSFTRTNAGEVVGDQISMYTLKIRSIGISILGGNSGYEGPYELGLDSIRAVTEEAAEITPADEKAAAGEKPKLPEWDAL